MNKVISTLGLVTAAVMMPYTANANTGDTSSATANWQGVVPGVPIPDGAIIVTGKDGSQDIPVGQLMRKAEGNLFGTVIDLEARAYTQPVETVTDPDGTPNSGDETSSWSDPVIGDPIDANWTVEEVKFYIQGAEIRGIGWEVFDGATSMATVDNAGVVTNDTTFSTTNLKTIELNIESDDTSNDAVNAYAGNEGALSVTVLATKV